MIKNLKDIMPMNMSHYFGGMERRIKMETENILNYGKIITGLLSEGIIKFKNAV